MDLGIVHSVLALAWSSTSPSLAPHEPHTDRVALYGPCGGLYHGALGMKTIIWLWHITHKPLTTRMPIHGP